MIYDKEHEPLPFQCPDPNLRADLQRLNDGLQETHKIVLHIRTLQEAANHRLAKLEMERERETGRQEVRQEWARSTAANVKWFIGTTLVAAGILSGIVFGVLRVIFGGA